MNEPLLAALRAVRDQITRLRVVEAGILNLLEGEPMPEPKSAGVADLPVRLPPGPESRPPEAPRRRRLQRLHTKLRIAAVLANGPARVSTIAVNAGVSAPAVYNIVLDGDDWFEKVPGKSPTEWQLTAIGREEYAKAKAQAPEES